MRVFQNRPPLDSQQRFSSNMPSVSFSDLFRREEKLYAATVAYNPIRCSLKLLNTNIAAPKIAIEMVASPKPVNFAGISFFLWETEGKSGKMFTNLQKQADLNPATSLPKFAQKWLSTGFTLQGLSAIIATNKISLTPPVAVTEFMLHASSGVLVHPLIRFRRAYATVVASENLAPTEGTPNGVRFSFSGTLAEKSICPCSFKLTFTATNPSDPTVHTHMIADDGNGNLVNVVDSLAASILLSREVESTINYKTGEYKVVFDAAYIPKNATNLVASYEHGERDSSVYSIQLMQDK